ncbi:type 1 glutamine amidotransferase [Candidatus Peregrinibacteria bacterium]|nr:type 1 glutamine amidotransferase [Candidatus Peregrinibacteria bacterium]
MKVLILDVIDFNKNVNALENVCKVLTGRSAVSSKFRAQKLHENDLIEEEIANADRIIISGSARSAYEDFHWKPRLKRALDLILESGKPTYAICFGCQFVAQEMGGKVIRNPNGPEFGSVKIALTEMGKKHPFLEGFDQNKMVHESHNDRVEVLPEGAVLLAYNDNSPVQAYQYKNIFASQFHPDLPVTNLLSLLELRKEKYLEMGFLKDEEDYQRLKAELSLGEAAYEILEKFLNFGRTDGKTKDLIELIHGAV